MPQLKVTTREGEVHTLDGQGGVSVMEMIRDAGIDELLALCGGCCSCATCHVYVDVPEGATLPPMSEDENELLDSAPERTETSRLSCQIKLDEGLDGLAVTIGPEG